MAEIKLAKPCKEQEEWRMVDGEYDDFFVVDEVLAERKQWQAALTKERKRAEKAEAENKKLKSLLGRVMRHLTNKGAFRVEPYSTEYEKLRDVQ